jgi:hypothetical protein
VFVLLLDHNLDGSLLFRREVFWLRERTTSVGLRDGQDGLEPDQRQLIVATVSKFMTQSYTAWITDFGRAYFFLRSECRRMLVAPVYGICVNFKMEMAEWTEGIDFLLRLWLLSR